MVVSAKAVHIVDLAFEGLDHGPMANLGPAIDRSRVLRGSPCDKHVDTDLYCAIRSAPNT